MPPVRKAKDLEKEIVAEGESIEAISFESVIKTIENEDDTAFELMKDLPSLPALLRQVHKHAFWRGADFGRLWFLKLADDDIQYEECD
jgi:hypothetical protein